MITTSHVASLSDRISVLQKKTNNKYDITKYKLFKYYDRIYVSDIDGYDIKSNEMSGFLYYNAYDLTNSYFETVSGEIWSFSSRKDIIIYKTIVYFKGNYYLYIGHPHYDYNYEYYYDYYQDVPEPGTDNEVWIKVAL